MSTVPAATSKKAIASLVLGILSLFCSFLTGIPALVLGVLSLRDIKASQGSLAGQKLAVGGIATGIVASLLSSVVLLIALLMLGVHKARDAAKRIETTNNLRQIGLALQIYHDSENKFPEADKNGLSWRVWILPYLEEDALFKQFRTDEPWDSPHNKKLLARMPRVYRHPRYSAPGAEQTYFRGIVGPNTVFGTRDINLGMIVNANGAAMTIMVVEAADPVPWTKPDEIVYKRGQPVPPLGGPKGDRFLALFADAHVVSLPVDMPPNTFRGLVEWNNTERIVLPP